jgi:hypothetical protein
VDSWRRRIGGRLVQAGATMALDREEMWRGYQRSGARHATNADLGLLFMLDVVSAAAIRLGMLIPPNPLPVN